MWFYHKLDNIPDYETITSIEQVPEGAIGFIYLIEYVDGCKYIGKKNLYSKRTIAATKSDILERIPLTVFIKIQVKDLDKHMT